MDLRTGKVFDPDGRELTREEASRLTQEPIKISGSCCTEGVSDEHEEEAEQGRVGEPRESRAEAPGRAAEGVAFNHKNDEAYRVKRAEGSRRHLEQVYRDAELGRMTREMLAGLGDVLARLAALKTAAQGNTQKED